MVKKVIRLDIILFVMFLVYSHAAHACVCGYKSNTLDEFERAEHVIIAKVASVKISEEGIQRYVYGAGSPLRVVGKVNGIESTIMTVEKVYKGSLMIDEAIELVQGGGADCIYTFSEENIEEEFLLYLDDAPKYALIRVCL